MAKANAKKFSDEHSNCLIMLNYNPEHYSENILRALCKEKINVNITNKFGNTALHYAIINKNLTAIQILIEAGANPNIKGHNSFVPYEYLTTEMKIHYEKQLVIRFESSAHVEDECIVCYDVRQVVLCPYKHGICDDCMNVDKSYKCLFCSNLYEGV